MVLLSNELLAVDAAPRIKRVCLNISDSVASVYWERVTDLCGSFTDYSIYGREDKFSLFQLLKKENNINTTSCQIKLPNRRRWEFFIVVNKDCSGVDSFSSDTIFLDNEEPTQWKLDSVSVDLNTQKLIAGWSKHDTTDVEGYYIYNVESGSNSLIGNENGFSFSGINEDPTTKAITHLISAYDSCNNASPLSSPSTTIFLTKSIDTCANTLTFNWSHYIGWNSIQEYALFVSINNGVYQNVGQVAGNIQTIRYIYTPGDTICAYIRAYNGEDNSISSSSNRLCETTNALVKPNILYIRKVTIEKHDSLKIYAIIDDANIDSLILQKRSTSDGWEKVLNFRLSGNNFTFTDQQALFTDNVYEYRLISFNACGQITDTSNTSKNIVLSFENDEKDLNWTEYQTFENGNIEYKIIKSINSSTWNNEATISEMGQNEYFYTPINTTDEDGNAFCYCAMAIENGINTYGYMDTSYSNMLCAKGEFVYHIPTAFKPEGLNTVFLPYFQNIETDGYNLKITNRWGEILYQSNDPLIGWDGNYQGKPCPMGAYVYLIQAYGKDGKLINKSGIINLLR